MKKLNSTFLKTTAAFLLAAMFQLSLSAQTDVYDDIIATSDDHTYLAAALLQQNLHLTLQDDDGTFTVFAPTDAAFENLAAALDTDISGLLALPNLTDILTYHVLDSEVPAMAVTNGAIVQPLSMTNTLKLTVTADSDVFVNQAPVSMTDLMADNGIVHVLDQVVLPSETVVDIAIDNGFTSLTAAVVTAELLPALTNPLATYTVFAPSDMAFADLAAALDTDVAGLLALPNLADILTYHVLDSEVPAMAVTNGAIVQPLSMTNTLKLTVTADSDVFVNQAPVSMTDLMADNGIVHVLDQVVLPSETVVDIAIDNGFTSLTAAVVTAELLPALTNPLATYTVFAPSDMAFADLAAALDTDVAGLLALPNLADILTYHVLDSEVPAMAVTNGAIVQPLSMTNTLKLTVTADSDVFVNQAPVSMTDLMADNGIVHVLDQVVLPSETVVDIAIDNGFTSLTAAVVTAELLPALTNPLATYTVFAPSDMAFADLAAALDTDVAGLLALPNLADILTYHVLDSEVPAMAVTNGAIVQPLSMTNTLKLTVTADSDVFVNQAPVSMTDLMADNGIVHVLDQVVLPSETVVDIAIDNGFTSLTAAVVTAELLPALTNPLATYTVFAPSDMAFADLAAALDTDVAGLLALPNLADILTYHVLDSEVPAMAVTNGAIVQPLSMTNTLKLTVTADSDVFVNQAPVSMTDLMADNGIVHVLDQVVLPSETVVDIAIDNGFTSLTAAVVTAELLPALTNPLATYTVFAPSDMAFADLAAALDTDVAGLLALPNLADILTYHVLDSEVPAMAVTNGAIVQPLSMTNTLKLTVTADSDVFVNQAPVSMTDLMADNGIVHVLDQVVLPSETVVDIAIDNGFTSLTAAVVTAELLPALTNPLATYTVFAPSDMAFADLAAALDTDVAGLLALPNLADILTYHVLDSEVPAMAVTNGAIVQPLSMTNTLKLTVTADSDVFVNQAPVSMTDLMADNGIVHVLDQVVLPSETVVDIAIDNGFTSLTAAVVTAELLPALTNPFASLTVFAPNNMAFDQLASDLGTDIPGLLALPNLGDILTYHVIGETLLADDFVAGSLATLSGESLNITTMGGVQVNGTDVVLADLMSDNGVVHVIGDVLVQSPTSVENFEDLKVEFYPNPSIDYINVVADENFNSLSILDLQGNEVRVFRLREGLNVINTNDIASGNYLLLFNGKQYQTVRNMQIISAY